MNLIKAFMKNHSLKGVDKMRSDWNRMIPWLLLVIAEHAETGFWLLYFLDFFSQNFLLKLQIQSLYSLW